MLKTILAFLVLLFAVFTLSANAGGISIINGVVGITNDVIPGDSPADSVQVYAEDVSSSSELKVRDEIGNITVLSPHAFVLFTPDESYELPFSYYSRNEIIGKEINVDMFGAMREAEKLTGKKFIYLRDISQRAKDIQ